VTIIVAVALALANANATTETCAAVRKDHEAFKAQAFAELKVLSPRKKGAPSAADRRRWETFERASDVKIEELNRRYANCREN
jgi:hypothetical protein